VAIRAILFDLGNTLVGYYTSSEFPLVLRRCLRECASALGHTEDHARDEDLFERALLLNREQSDYAVRPLSARLQELFGADEALDEASARALGTAFLKPIFAMARPDPQAVPLLEALRGRGIKTAVVSNTPCGSPADAWRAELTRHGLLDKLDAAVFAWMSGGVNLIARRLIEPYRCLPWRPQMRCSWAMTTDGISSVLRTPVSVRFFSSRLRRSRGASTSRFRIWLTSSRC
jgi:phosphoglycolate phosphatase-like HAD superfamily hydrolase